MCGVVWCYAGDPAQADKALEPVRALSPALYGVGPMPYPAAAERVRRALPAGAPVVLARRLRERAAGRGDRAARASTARRCRRCSRRCTCTRSTAPCTGSGARTRPSITATRSGPRSSSASTPIPANGDRITAWCKNYWEALHPYSAGGAYVNFMMDEGAGARAGHLPGQLPEARRHQAEVRSRQPVPGQPEHQACGCRQLTGASVSHDEPLPMALDSPREAGGPRREARLPPSCQRAPGEVHESPHRLQPGHRRGRSCRGGHDRSQAGKCPGRKHRRVQHPVRRQQEPRGRTSRRWQRSAAR